ncbi:MAG: ABC transporter substrate-binding protein [Pseudomonadota bacterium]
MVILNNRINNAAIAITAMALLCLVSCQSDDPDIIVPDSSTGVSDREILIGSSLALGGHAGYLGTQILQGAMAYIQHINDTGGIHGRTIRVITYDDGYDPPRCLFNTQKLIIEDNVFALFSYVGTPTTVKIIPLINEARIPLVGMFTGSSRLRNPVNRYLINIRASYYQEIEAAVAYMVNQIHLNRIAVFYQYDEFGFDGLRGTELALKSYGLKPVAKGSYVRGTLDVEDGLDRVTSSGAQAVVMIGTYDACAEFISLALEQNFSPVFYNVSFVGSEELARRLSDKGEGVIITQVVPPPNIMESAPLLPGVQEYAELLTRYFPESRPNFVGLEGFLNAKVLVEGFSRAGFDLTRESFINALESIKDLDLGISNTLSFSTTDHQGLDKVYFTKIHQGHLVMMQ